MSKKPQNDTVPAAYEPRLPSVNLLPEDIREIVKIEAAYRWLALVAVGVLLVLGGGFTWKHTDVATADTELAAAQREEAQLTAEQSDLADVGAFYEKVAENQQTIQQAMSKEALFSDLLVRLYNAAAQGVSLDTIAVAADTDATVDPTQTASSAGSCPSPDPFNPDSAVGCVNISGKADSREQVGTFLDTLEQDGHFVGGFVSSTTVDPATGAVAFTATIGLTDEVFSGRYQDVTFLKGEQK